MGCDYKVIDIFFLKKPTVTYANAYFPLPNWSLQETYYSHKTAIA